MTTKTKMDFETLTALKGSILKWEKIVAGTGFDRGEDNCPLCELFPYCTDCPVALHTGKVGCCGTAYADWLCHTYVAHANDVSYFRPHKGFEKEAQEIAQAMLDFLRSLLPSD